MVSLKEIQTKENKMTIYKNMTSVRTVTWDNKVWYCRKWRQKKSGSAQKRRLRHLNEKINNEIYT